MTIHDPPAVDPEYISIGDMDYGIPLMDGEEQPPAQIELTNGNTIDKRKLTEIVKMIVMIVILSYLILWFAIYLFHNFREPIRSFFDSLIRQLIL